MISSSKLLMICTLFLIGINHLNAQYATGDFNPTAVVSDGLRAPGRMAVDSNDNIYAADVIQKSIVKYDGQGNYQTTISTDFSPTSIAINDNDLLFVGDKGTGNIYIVSENGDKTLFYSGTTTPNAMVFGLNILYLTYSKEKKVIGLDISGTIVTDFTYEKFVYPTGIAFDPYNNYLLVAEHGGIGEDMERPGSCSMCWSSYGPQTAIYAFDLEGNHKFTFGFFGNEDGQFQRIQGVDVGMCGNYYAVDPYLGRISVFDNSGNYITKFGYQGNNLGEFNLPMDIVFKSDNSAFVSSMNKGELDVFSINSILPTATITSTNQTVCSLTDAEVEVLLTGTAPWSFTYTIDGLNPQIINTAEITTDPLIKSFNLPVAEVGLYEITAITDSTNTSGTCLTGAAFIQESIPPTATILTSELTKCSTEDTGIKVQFNGLAPFTFTYTIDGLNPTEIITTNNLYILKPEQSGFYEITTLTDAGCSGTEILGNAAVTVQPLPTATVISDTFEVFINPGEVADVSISFTGSAPYTFTYLKDEINLTSITTSDNPYIFNVSEEGNYKITSISDAYCSNNEQQGHFDLVFNDIVLPTATIVSETICENDPSGITINFTGIGPWSFTYTIDGLNPTEVTTANSSYVLVPSSSGLFELVSIYDSLDNTGTVSGSTTVYPMVTADYFYEVTNKDVQFTNSATNANTYYWDFGDGTSSTDPNPIHSYAIIGNYSVNFTANSTYCGSSELTQIIEVTGNVLSDDSNNNFKNNLLAFYPNPSNGAFTIKITSPNPIVSDISIAITSSAGQTIYSEVFNPFEAIYYDNSIYKEINISRFTKGVYIVYVQAENFVAQEKLILKD